MAKIQLGAKAILDPSKADTGLTYEWIPDVWVPVEKQVEDDKGKTKTVTTQEKNIELGKENGIWFLKKHVTAGQKSRLDMKIDRDGGMGLPAAEYWKETVVEAHGLYNGDVALTPADILNAIGSNMADSLLIENYRDSKMNAELTEDERKN